MLYSLGPDVPPVHTRRVVTPISLALTSTSRGDSVVTSATPGSPTETRSMAASVSSSSDAPLERLSTFSGASKIRCADASDGMASIKVTAMATTGNTARYRWVPSTRALTILPTMR